MVRTFQLAKVLSRLTVLDNMLLAAPQQTGEKFVRIWFQKKKIATEEKQNQEQAMLILKSVGLADKAHDYAGALSGGQRKLLEIAQAMMSNPKLLLLDEPTAGINPILIEQICQHIIEWNQKGISFLIIEHNMNVIMSLCPYAIGSGFWPRGEISLMVLQKKFKIILNSCKLILGIKTNKWQLFS